MVLKSQKLQAINLLDGHEDDTKTSQATHGVNEILNCIPNLRMRNSVNLKGNMGQSRF